MKLRVPTASEALMAATIIVASPIHAKGISIHRPANLFVDQFQQNCTDMGGTSDSKEKDHTRCTLPSGTTVDCANDSRGQIDICTSTRTISSRDAAVFSGGGTGNTDRISP